MASVALAVHGWADRKHSSGKGYNRSATERGATEWRGFVTLKKPGSTQKEEAFTRCNSTGGLSHDLVAKSKIWALLPHWST